MSTEKRCILAIDDAPIVLRALGHILKEDYNVIVAKSGEQGIELAKKHNPSLILLDVMMPEMSGFDVIKLLKADNATKSIPIILTTGDDSTASREKGYVLGAADYIEKPFSEIVVKKRVEFNIQFVEMQRMLGI